MAIYVEKIILVEGLIGVFEASVQLRLVRDLYKPLSFIHCYHRKLNIKVLVADEVKIIPL